MKTSIKLLGDIICLSSTANYDEIEAKEVIDFLESNYFSKEGKKYSIFFDLNNYKTSTVKARYMCSNFLRKNDEKIEKFAVFPMTNKNSEIAVKVVLAISGFDKACLFQEKSEAQKWLNLETI